MQDQNSGKVFADEAAAIYERAITTLLKNNMLLYFAYADFEEVPNTSHFIFVEIYLLTYDYFLSVITFWEKNHIVEPYEVRESPQHLQTVNSCS